CMPAVVSSTVGSLRGISEELGTARWPRSVKYSTKRARISSPEIPGGVHSAGVGGFLTVGRFAGMQVRPRSVTVKVRKAVESGRSASRRASSLLYATGDSSRFHAHEQALTSIVIFGAAAVCY